MFSALGYLFLFLLICILLIAGIAAINIQKKGYYPKNAIIITSTLLFLIAANGILASLSLIRIKDSIQNTSQKPSPTVPQSKNF